MTKIKFYKKSHKYKVGKKELMSVTTFVKSFFPEFDDKAIAKKLVYVRRKQGIHTTASKIIKEWKAIAAEGTLVHKQVEESINNKSEPTHLKAKVAVDVLSRLTEGKEIKLESEKVLFDTDFGLAGTTDLIIVHPDNKVDIVDWKTNTNIRMKGYEKSTHEVVKDLEHCNYTHYTLQLSTYALMLEKQGYTINKLYLVHLKENVSDLYEVEYKKEKVKEMIEWHLKNKKN